MGTGSAVKTDLYHLNNYVQNTLITYTKDLFIENCRELFSKDSYYHYQRDEWGHPKIDDHTNLSPNAGLTDHSTSRLFIGEKFRKSPTGIFYPALLISDGGTRSVPISMSRDRGSVQWQVTKVTDGYGNEKILHTPAYFVQTGAWEGSIIVDIHARESGRTVGELHDIVILSFTDKLHDEMIKSGVLIKGSSSSGTSETDDRNGKIFKKSITFEVRSEWRRHLPIKNIVEIINVCVDFVYSYNGQIISSPGLAIEQTIDLVDYLNNL